jgi:methylenetetrahydrofolate reductase (NADPH)
MVAKPEAMPATQATTAPSRGVRAKIGTTIRKPLLGSNTPYLRELVEGAKLELIPMKSLERAITELRPNSSISMTCSPAKSIEATLDETERLTADGHHVTPHISARMVHDRAHLDDIVARLATIGVRDIFVVGGDADPRGCFFDAIEFLDALLELDPAIDHIGYTSYPDTHPLISNELLHEALHRKQDMILSTGRTAHVSTQMCFSPDQIRAWLRRERDAGLTVPVHLGIPGVIDRTKLMTMGVRLGIGTSLRYLSKNRKAIGKLMTQRSYTPDLLLRPLSDRGDAGLAGLGIGGLHLYTFNQVDATETWRLRTLNP